MVSDGLGSGMNFIMCRLKRSGESACYGRNSNSILKTAAFSAGIFQPLLEISGTFSK